MDQPKTPVRKRTNMMKPPPIVRKKPRVCQGCVDNQPNQQAHMGGTGCLPDWNETSDEFDARKGEH